MRASEAMEDILMKRKPKMHGEKDFDIDNMYQDDDRQIDVDDDECARSGD